MRRSVRSRTIFPEDSEDEDDDDANVFDSRTKQTMNANFAAIRSNGITASLNYLNEVASTMATTKATATATATANVNVNVNGKGKGKGNGNENENESENENGILLSRTPTEERLVSPAQLLMSTSKSFGLRLLSKIAVPTSLPTSPSSSSSSSSNAMQHRHHAKLTNNNNNNNNDDDDDNVHSDLTYEEEVNQLKQDNVFNQNLSSDEGKYSKRTLFRKM